MIKKDFGFIILRHVNSSQTNEYWKLAYQSIRQIYQNLIVIIDDNSNKDFLNEKDIVLTNCIIVEGEFPKRGEILPYYYFYKNHYFEKAVIIHDSVFIKKFIDFENMQRVVFFWNFEHKWDKPKDEIPLLHYMCKSLNNDFFSELFDLHSNPDKWQGSFGAISVIDHSYLVHLQNKYNFLELINHIDTRILRMAIERILGLICCHDDPSFVNVKPLAEDIHGYILYLSNNRTSYEYSFDMYLEDIQNNRQKDASIIKIFTGR
jgi:hypothetical protein